jgi:predicted nucleic acid-binding protein
MLYLDTSLIVSFISNETSTPIVQRWLQHQFNELAISHWTITELSSAMSIKLRRGEITANLRDEALGKFDEFRVVNLTLLPVKSAHFGAAASFADRYDLGVRANDALHLAIAADRGATVCTLDRRLAAAGPALGVPTKVLL